MAGSVSQRTVVSQDAVHTGQSLGRVALFNEDGTPFTAGGEAPDLSTYAPLASPTFTGDVKAPTPALADNDTSVATTAFVLLNAGKTKAQIVATTAVAAANAVAAAADPPTKAEFDAVVTLANELKTKLNALITAIKA